MNFYLNNIESIAPFPALGTFIYMLFEYDMEHCSAKDDRELWTNGKARYGSGIPGPIPTDLPIACE